MAKKTRGLGRGLEALLPDAEEVLSSGVQEISLGDIDPNPDQPRRTFSDESIAQLAQSIREQGVLQPILVTPQNGGRYRIVAGERRWRASRAAGLDKVPVIVRDLDVIQQMEIALIENLQREDLNPIEVAQGIRSLMQQCGYTQETVANRLSKSRPAVANLLRLLTLPEEVIELVRQGSLSAGHARVLAGLEDDKQKLALARETIEQGYSVRQLEALAAAAKESPAKADKPKPRKAALTAELSELEGRIRETMGVRATLTGTEKKGKIVLQYYSREELEHLNEMLLRLEE
ncbi:MAG: ParB/RepB/Spo0J family partition protein [Clostridia bacterium]|nr:ParB/RepB/Spo0J family partition protein [Clostridia bacterium]